MTLKRLIIALALLCAPVVSQTVPVTGYLLDGSHNPIPGSYVSFSLYNCGPNFPQAAGGTIVATTVTLKADSTGLVSGTIIPNDVISCGGVSDAVRWLVTPMQSATKPLQATQRYNILSGAGTFNFNTAVPDTTNPPAPVFSTLGAPNVAVYFTNALTASVVSPFNTPNIVWDCWDNHVPGNSIEPSATLNASTQVVTFTFLVPQTGYCVVNGTGGTVAGGPSPATNFVDLTTNQSIGGSKAFSSPVAVKGLNSVQFADQFAGATADVKINACITAAIISASGVCDARGLGGTQTIAAQVNVGDSAQDQVLLLLPSLATWNVAITDGTSCAIKQYGGSALIGLDQAGSNQMVIRPLNSSTSVAYWYCTDLAGGSYIRAESFQIYNPGTVATTTGIGVYLYGTYDNSAWRNVVVADYIDTYAVKVVGLCCDTVFDNVTIAGPGYSGGPHANAVTPLWIDNGFDGNQITFFGSSIDHPGDGKPNVLINSSLSNLSNTVDFNGAYMESSAYDTTTPFLSLTGTHGEQLSLNINGLRASAIVASATKPILSSSTTGVASIYSRAVKAISTFTLPLTAIIDTPTGASVVSDAYGNVRDYNNSGIATSSVLKLGPGGSSLAGASSGGGTSTLPSGTGTLCYVSSCGGGSGLPATAIYEPAGTALATLQAAINGASPGSEIWLSGSYTGICGLTVTTAGIRIRGFNQYSTTLQCNTPGSPVITFSGAGLNGGDIRDVTLQHTGSTPTCAGGVGTSTCGDGLQIAGGASRVKIENVHTNFNYDGMALGYTAYSELSNSVTEFNNNHGVVFVMDATHKNMQWQVSRVLSEQNLGNGFDMTCPASFTSVQTPGPYITGWTATFGNAGKGFNFSCSAATTSGIADVWMSNVFSSQNNGSGFYLDPGPNGGRNFILNNVYSEQAGTYAGTAGFASATQTPTNTGYGIEITSSCDNTTAPIITGGILWQNSFSGAIASCPGTSFSNIDTDNNGAAAASAQTEAGITINATDVSVNGGYHKKSSNQNYGVYVLSGDTPHVVNPVCDSGIGSANCVFSGSAPTNGYQQRIGQAIFTTSGSTNGFTANGFLCGGVTFTSSGGLNDSALTGGATCGKFTTATLTTGSTVVTMGSSATAPHGWACSALDVTHPADVIVALPTSATTITLTIVGSITAGDVIQFGPCEGY